MLFAIFFVRRWLGSRFRLGGSWRGAAALILYALPFSIAYFRLGAGTGALVLFSSVQFGMVGRAIIRGERPRLLEWPGLAVAFAAFAYLISPGLIAPDPLGTALMIGAGLCSTYYSLVGRSSSSPLADSTGNFARCVPLAIALVGVGWLAHRPSSAGLAYAFASGALASGLGCAIWYLVLPSLSRVRASIVQLTVPAIAATGGVLFVGEPLTSRIVLSSVGILGGIALSLAAAEQRKRSD